ncbi:AbiH family protein [Phocaeicola sp. KGMB11183]|uniref:AbiH family protein n=1 Tax=Phocaeicola acetigenes TaxID=3016083 RepID=A0ABT4PFR0_9BACT|nr:AbiH family protein [Phocaeicola sp. KGMB11183]MCZ8371887.1 AbiH family protein [Phocaeicola sp. KGMB11183]
MNDSTAHKTLFILGNGFDLDLNLKTSYNDFLSSKYFLDHCVKFINEPSISEPNVEINIFNFLQKQKNIRGWIDVEKELAFLASRKVREKFASLKEEGVLASVSEREKQTFQQLRISLCDYLKSINYHSIKIDSYGLKILKILNNKDSNSEIITFNYTDINKLAPIIGDSNIAIPIKYMHGNLESRESQFDDTSIILGFQDDIEIDDSYCFMIKSHSPYYTSHNLKSKLDQADEVIFFGHSLGSTDYPYFEDFFRKQCAVKPDNEKIKVRIFTYDEESRQSILIQLRNMNEKHTQMLYEYCDFAIYRTKDYMDDDKIEDYLSDLKSRIYPQFSYIG